MQLFHNKLSKRLQIMEACFNQQRGKNKVFDQINDRITIAEQWQKQNQLDNNAVYDRLQAQIDTMRLEIKQLFTRADDVGSEMERCREEMKDVYRLFTENDQKIINDYLKNKVEMDAEISNFKTRVSFFDSEMENMKNTLTEHNIVVENSKKLVYSV